MLQNVAEYISFLNPNMRVIGNTDQRNNSVLSLPGELYDTTRVDYMGFQSVDEMIASMARGDIFVSNEYDLLATPSVVKENFSIKD